MAFRKKSVDLQKLRNSLHGLFLILSLQGFADPQLIIEPFSAPIDQIVSIQIIDLQPHEKVKISAHLTDEKNRSWDSYALFEANEQGIIDLRRQAPLLGSYLEIDPMGLFWSMQLSEDAKERTCYLHSSMEPISVEIAAELKDQNALKSKVIRQIAFPGIQKIPVSEEGLVGNFFLPKGNGPFPGIIVLGSSDGGIPPDAYVSQFANQGYAALGLAYIKEKGLPQKFVGVRLEYFQRAIEWMKKRRELQADRLMICGFSMGGTTALLVASHYPEIKGVISASGRGIVTLEEYSCKETGLLCSPYTFQGKPLPFVLTQFPPAKEDTAQTSYFLSVYLSSIFRMTEEEIEKTAIPVEKINGPILMFAGLDDRRAGAAILSDIAYKRLATHPFSFPYQLITYSGAGHLIGTYALPYTPATNMNFSIPPLKTLYNVGGISKCNAEATIDCWKETFKFLRDVSELE